MPDTENSGRSSCPPVAYKRSIRKERQIAREGTLCRDSMPERERTWLRLHRPEAAAHWSLLTGLTAEQLPYAAR